jgi:UDPglucose 6-dehydrogenase
MYRPRWVPLKERHVKITVFGAGYVGLAQAAVLADIGHVVVCVDANPDIIRQLRRGTLPIFEPGLEPLIRDGQANGRLRFTSDAAAGVHHARIQFVAVGTPTGEGGAADLSSVMAVADAIARHADAPQLVVLKSTVPVGTGDRVRARIAQGLAARGRGNLDFDVASNPEFLKEGSAVADCAKPDRIIIGTATRQSEATLREIYAPLSRNHEKIIVMDGRSAELTKYAANAMLATKISFMNEIANLADHYGADIEKVRRGIGADPRIGYDFIYAGIGFGGSCFPKDLRALINMSEAVGFEPRLIEAVVARNEKQKLFLFERIAARFGPQLTGATFALWGLAFKPNTDDIRESPACALLEKLLAAGARVRAFDPKAMDRCRERYAGEANLRLCASQDEALIGAEALIVATEWRAFQAPDFDALRKTLLSPVIFDGRNIYDPAIVSRHGLTVISVGRSATPGPLTR